MSNGLVPVKIAGVCLAAAFFLAVVVMLRNTQKHLTPNTISSAAAENLPSCTGESIHSSNRQHPADTKRHPHSVTLSWNAAVPASNSPRDAIQGYYVYRSLASRTFAEANRISDLPVQVTRCVDATGEPGKTYYYVVKGVSQSGTQSGFSAEIRVVVPSR